MKKVLAVLVCLVLVLGAVMSVPVSASSAVSEQYWADSSEDMVPQFLISADYGTPEPIEYGLQFNATGSFSGFTLVLCGKGSMTVNVYEWYYNYDATVAQESVRSVKLSWPSDGFYKVEFDSLPAGE